MVAVRKGMTFRSPFFMAGCSRIQISTPSRAPPGDLGESGNDHKDDIFCVKALLGGIGRRVADGRVGDCGGWYRD
jgi:hypothetical protein